MFNGPQPENEGKCNAVLRVGDDFGDNSATFRCQLEPNHDDLHKETWGEEGDKKTITWEKDERETCPQCSNLFDSRHNWHNEYQPLEFPCCYKTICVTCSEKFVKNFKNLCRGDRIVCSQCSEVIVYDGFEYFYSTDTWERFDLGREDAQQEMFRLEEVFKDNSIKNKE